MIDDNARRHRSAPRRHNTNKKPEPRSIGHGRLHAATGVRVTEKPTFSRRLTRRLVWAVLARLSKWSAPRSGIHSSTWRLWAAAPPANRRSSEIDPTGRVPCAAHPGERISRPG